MAWIDTLLNSFLPCSSAGDWLILNRQILLITTCDHSNRKDKHTLYIIIGSNCCYIDSCLGYRNDGNPDGHLIQWTTVLYSSFRSDLLCLYPRPMFMLWMRHCRWWWWCHSAATRITQSTQPNGDFNVQQWWLMISMLTEWNGSTIITACYIVLFVVVV